jgi:hypothetical protein
MKSLYQFNMTANGRDKAVAVADDRHEVIIEGGSSAEG